MSNIDFSRMITGQTKVAQTALAHAEATKSECKRRILAQIPVAAQQNISQAVTLHALNALRDQPRDAAVISALNAVDIERATQAWDWIAAMQAACRALSDDPTADPLADSAWPILPDSVTLLIDRF